MENRNRTKKSGRQVPRRLVPPAGKLLKSVITQQRLGGPSKRRTIKQGPERDCTPSPLRTFIGLRKIEHGPGMSGGSKRHELQDNPPKRKSECEVPEIESSLFMIYGTKKSCMRRLASMTRREPQIDAVRKLPGMTEFFPYAGSKEGTLVFYYHWSMIKDVRLQKRKRRKRRNALNRD